MEQPSHAVTNHAMVPMSAFDPQAEDTPSSIGNSLGRRPLARKKLSEMVEEELEQMIGAGSLRRVNSCRPNVS